MAESYSPEELCPRLCRLCRPLDLVILALPSHQAYSATRDTIRIHLYANARKVQNVLVS